MSKATGISILLAFLTGMLSPFAFAVTTWPAQVAGKFYPSEAAVLKADFQTYGNSPLEKNISGRPVALVAPHAGYRHSGKVAVDGYRAVAGFAYDRILILAGNHFIRGKPFRGAALLDVDAMATPLGEVPVDREAVRKITTNAPMRVEAGKSTPLIAPYEPAFQGEHSLDVQLPLVREFLPDTKIIPVMLGALAEDDFAKIAAVLRPFVTDKTLIITSSDFTHYGTNYGFVPFKEKIEEQIRTLDYGAFDRILKKDFAGMKSYRDKTAINACGWNPLRLLTKLLPDAVEGEVLRYDTLGRQTGQFATSVTYAALLFTRRDYSESERATLLKLARDALEDHVRNGRSPKLDAAQYNLTSRLKEQGAAFISLYNKDGLRGCMGHVFAQMPLYESVMVSAMNAASKDGRFKPVRVDELSGIKVHVSVLTPLVKVGPDVFDPAKDGILLTQGGKRAVFLPGVATDNKWNRAQTYVQLCLKAGLPIHAWKEPDAEFFIFHNEVDLQEP